MPEFFGKRFGSKGLKIGASIIVFIFLIPYTASLYNGLSRLFGMAFNIDYTLCIILMAALTCVYVVAGGYMATAINDFIQGLIMLGGIVVVVLAVLNENGGFMAAMDALARVEDALRDHHARRVHLLLRPPSRWNFSAWSSSPRWAPGGFRRWCRSSTPSARKRPSTRARVISTLFAVVVAGGCYFLGGFGRALRGARECRRRRLRRHHPRDAGKPLAASDRHRRHPRAFGIHVHALQPGHGLQLHPDARPSQGQCRQGHGREKTGADHARPHRGCSSPSPWSSPLCSTRATSPSIAQLMGVSWGALAGAFLAPLPSTGFTGSAPPARRCGSASFSARGVMTLNLFCPSIFPYPPPVAHQLRRVRHARGSGCWCRW